MMDRGKARSCPPYYAPRSARPHCPLAIPRPVIHSPTRGQLSPCHPAASARPLSSLSAYPMKPVLPLYR